MSDDKYLSSNRSALFSIDDQLDDEFLHRPRVGTSNYVLDNSSRSVHNSISLRDERDSFEARRLQLLKQKREIEERSVESSNRSLSLLRNSEEIGVATAEELMKQREQLQRTNERLDDINSTLGSSQKHIEGIKSIFGSLKNYLSGKPDSNSPPAQKYTNTKLNQDKITFSQLSDASTSSKTTQHDNPGFSMHSAIGENAQATISKPQEIIDNNIEEMISSISKLKGLATGLGEEIESQNDLIDDVVTKVEKSDITLRKQNKDIQRLLK